MAEEILTLTANDAAWLLPRSPSSAFVCWTWNRAKAEAFASGAYGASVVLRLAACDDKSLCSEDEAPWDAGRAYLKPPAEGRPCAAAVYARKSDGTLEKLLESNMAVIPVSGPRGGVSAGYASAEFIRRAE